MPSLKAFMNDTTLDLNRRPAVQNTGLRQKSGYVQQPFRAVPNGF